MPTLVDGDIVVVNSADIVAYLDDRYPAKPIHPEQPAARVHARAWERTADIFIDPILINVSYWKWAERPDEMPQGLLEAARGDLQLIYDALDQELAHREFVSGPLSVADIALFPHLANAKAMEVPFTAQQHPNLARWFKQMRSLPICLADLRRARDFVVDIADRISSDAGSSGEATVLNGCWPAASAIGSLTRSNRTERRGQARHYPRG